LNNKGLIGLQAFHSGWCFVQFKSSLHDRLKTYFARENIPKDGNYSKKMYDCDDTFIMVHADVITRFEEWWDKELKRIKESKSRVQT